MVPMMVVVGRAVYTGHPSQSSRVCAINTEVEAHSQLLDGSQGPQWRS
ncbi:mCG1028556 [Mus musculus]|nr:mCG1028556 [Mus musculus]